MAVLGKSDVIRTASWMRKGLAAARCVGRMETADDQPLATGFLIAGDQIGEQFAEMPVFLTADYALNDYGSGSADHVVFEGLYDDPSAAAEVGIQDVLWSSEEVHAAVCLLDAMPGDVTGLRAAPTRPAIGDGTTARAWVVGYPRGGSLAVGLEDNEILGIEEPMLHYRTATEPGSGGSPVFNAYWEVMAMHVLGRRDQNYNAGPLIDVVLDQAAAALRHKKVAPPPAAATSPATQPRQRSTLSAFISYNGNDVQFAERLYTALQGRGVRCWWDKRDMAPGDLIDAGIQAGINESDRILLCCSEHSLGNSAWVDAELEFAFERERALHKATGGAKSVVIPLDLDGYLFDGFEGPKGPQLRKRSAADFTQWRESAAFEAAVDNLLRALVTEDEAAPEDEHASESNADPAEN